MEKGARRKKSVKKNMISAAKVLRKEFIEWRNHENDSTIPLAVFLRRVMNEIVVSKKQKQKKKKIEYKLSVSDEEPSDEPEENRKPPMEPQDYPYYAGAFKHIAYPPPKVPESDEEVFGDSDCDDSEFDFKVKKRVEYDSKLKFVVRKRWETVTDPKFPKIIYFGRKYFERERECFEMNRKSKKICKRWRPGFTDSVLHDPDFPLAAISKLALKTYNTIQNTEYEYVGLVKAYSRPVAGFLLFTRFKARLRGQHPINFQASTVLAFPRKHCYPVQVKSVYPLPTS